MNHPGKMCDAADWFRPELSEIIRHELQEVPQFHRKQWEFAMIITGLNAPKGLGIYQNRLYVADISDVVVINIKKGKVEKNLSVLPIPTDCK